MKTIRKSIEINASDEKVWDVLTQDTYTREWLAIFSPGSYALTDWQLGSKVVFADHTGSGIIGRIIVYNPYELLSIEYYGVLNDNKEDFDSPEADIFKGAREIYQLSSNEGKTVLDIESDISEGAFDTMSESWDEALIKIKSLAEA
ncbi:SRPBCC family protein [Emticicia fontis]